MEKQAITSRLTQLEKKKIKSLLTKKGRNQEGLFVAEGIRLLEESLRFKRRPRKIYYVPDKLTSRANKLVEKFISLSIPSQVVSPTEMEQISEAETSQGILALFEIPDYPIRQIFFKGRFILFLDNISDPGNAGTLIRSALAFGFDTIISSKNSVDFYNPKVVRSTAGAIFGLKVETFETTDIINEMRRTKTPLVVADLYGDNLKIGLRKIRPKKKLVFAIGSESGGLSAEIKNAAKVRLKINHLNKVESLNASVAGSIIMQRIYEEKII